MLKLGIDVGGTITKVIVADESYKLVYSDAFKTETGQMFCSFLTEIIDGRLKEFPEIEGVGIGIPGTVNTENSTILQSPNLGLRSVELVKLLAQDIDIPIKIENDVNAWALGEMFVGCCKNVKNYVLITVGTGIGAGLVLGGSIYRGANFEAGEIGYMVSDINIGSTVADKSSFGPFEKKASAIATSHTYFDRSGIDIDTRQIYQRARYEHEPLAIEVVNSQLDSLAVGISNVICILQPQKIVIGGGLANEGEYLANRLNEKVHTLIETETVIVLAGSGKWGGAIGAAFM